MKLGGCNPDTNQSDACAAWAWRASKVRSQRLDSLNFQAVMEMLAGYLLLLTGDIINLTHGTVFDRVSAGFDLLSLIFNSVLPYLGQAFKSSSVYQAVLQFASVGMRIMAGLQAVVGAIRSVSWWIERPAEFTANLLLGAASGPAGIIVQGLFMLVKPMVGDILDSTAYYLQSLAFSDYAEEERESSMPLQDWCNQYGGCPSYSS